MGSKIIIQGGAEFPTQKYLLATQGPAGKYPCLTYQNKENGLQFVLNKAGLHMFQTGKTARLKKVLTFLGCVTGQKLNFPQKS